MQQSYCLSLLAIPKADLSLTCILAKNTSEYNADKLNDQPVCRKPLFSENIALLDDRGEPLHEAKEDC